MGYALCIVSVGFRCCSIVVVVVVVVVLVVCVVSLLLLLCCVFEFCMCVVVLVDVVLCVNVNDNNTICKVKSLNGYDAIRQKYIMLISARLRLSNIKPGNNLFWVDLFV